LFTVVADSAPFNRCVYSAAQGIIAKLRSHAVKAVPTDANGRKKRSKHSKDESSKDAVRKKKKKVKETTVIDLSADGTDGKVPFDADEFLYLESFKQPNVLDRLLERTNRYLYIFNWCF
jgi:hypothetical protein